MDFVYAVLLRYPAGTLRGIGERSFTEPLFVGGPAVLDNDNIWTVVELRMDETPPAAVVERRGSSASSTPGQRGSRTRTTRR
jgi:hypothetical protein